MTFTAPVITGTGRGKGLGTPTVNLNLDHIPPELEQGIFVCTANDQPAVMHYGLRPVFDNDMACEIHFIDIEPKENLESLTVTVIEKIRDVQNFDSVDALKDQIQKDIQDARAILSRS